MLCSGVSGKRRIAISTVDGYPHVPAGRQSGMPGRDNKAEYKYSNTPWSLQHLELPYGSVLILCLLLTLTAMAARLTSSFPNLPQFSGFQKPCRLEGEIQALQIHGEIPADINGTFYRVMPDPQMPPFVENDSVWICWCLS